MKKVPFEYVDCSKCADLERQLAEEQGKLDEIERYAARLGGGHSLCTWQGLVKSDLDRILSKEGE